jgi:hypothetical protein
MTDSFVCAHEPCGCRTRREATYCSAECEAAASRNASECDCPHPACGEPDRSRERSIDGNQGEGNREADRRYREAASAFARSPRSKQAAREAADELDDDPPAPDRPAGKAR